VAHFTACFLDLCYRPDQTITEHPLETIPDCQPEAFPCYSMSHCLYQLTRGGASQCQGADLYQLTPSVSGQHRDQVSRSRGTFGIRAQNGRQARREVSGRTRTQRTQTLGILSLRLPQPRRGPLPSRRHPG
jgi:hypothetical protein